MASIKAACVGIQRGTESSRNRTSDLNIAVTSIASLRLLAQAVRTAKWDVDVGRTESSYCTRARVGNGAAETRVSGIKPRRMVVSTSCRSRAMTALIEPG